MQVGFLTSSYPDHPGHPRGIFVHRLAKSLVEEGLEVTVVAPGSDRARPYEERDGVQIRRLRYWLSGDKSITQELSGIAPAIRRSPWKSVQLLPLFARMVEGASSLTKSCDLLHAHWLYPAGTAAVVGSLGRETPVVVTCHGGDINLARSSAPLRLIAQTVLRRSDCCIAVSPRDKETIREWAPKAPRVEFLPVGVDIGQRVATIDALTSGTAPTAFRRSSSFNVLYVGSLVRRKSVATLLDALHALRDRERQFECVVVGDGPEGPELKMRARELRLDNVTFVGSRPPDEIAGWMNAANVFVLPSLSEPWGSVVAEAMAVGTPVIVSETAGSSILVRNGVSGFTFPERDATALARRLMQLADLPDIERSKMGIAATESIVEHGVSTEAVAGRYHSIYRDVLS